MTETTVLKGTILVTGGTGSFGSTVAKKLAMDFPDLTIRIFSRDEKKQFDLRTHLKLKNVEFVIGDIRDKAAIDIAMRGVDYVFHAAALKQVPSCEFFPMEAVKTNIIGANNVFEAAELHGVKKVVVLSTDKAAYPINAMGISKAMMEKLAISKILGGQKSNTKFCVTRYGNVMASRGSVIPTFVESLKSGREITITDPKMTRFIMSLDQSVELVLYALRHSVGGEIFVMKAPACDIHTLVEALKTTFAKPNHPIKIIGQRHGEKMYECLLTKEERFKAEERSTYFIVPPDTRGLDYEKYFAEGQKDISSRDEYNSNNTRRLSIAQLQDVLMSLPYIRDQLNA